MSANMLPTALVANLFAFWPFAHGWMLLWGFAAVLPLLIHFLSRRRYDEVPWAAMEFLLAAIRKHARRWRIEQLLLLVVRTSILLLLALALADPILSLFGAVPSLTGSAGNSHLVLVLDASYSMDYRQTDATCFDLAKGLAGETVRNSVQGDGFSLILLAAPPTVVVGDPVFDREDLADEIAELRRTDGGADLSATLAEIERLIERAARREPRLQRRRICFFTDMGRATWGEVSSSSTQAVLARLAEKAELQVVDVGQPGGQNVAVTRVAVADGIVTADCPTRIELEVENLGNQERTQHTVEVLVDGQRIAEEHLDIPAGGRSSTAVVHAFPIPGEHVVEVHSGEDRLEVDNHRWLSLEVRPALEVLCVEGRSGAAKNVVFALEPGLSAQARVRPSIQSEIALLEEDLHRYDCIFLCNVGRFGRDEAHLLHGFLAEGGGVVMFLGDQVQPTNYNSILGAEAGELQILPAQVGEPVPLGEFFFDPLAYRHPIVEPFRGHERSGLLTTPIWKYVKLTPLPGRGVQTALAFENGDPAVLESTLGRGHVILVATDGSSTSLDPSTNPPTPWSALAGWPSFPPLVQQMLKSAVRGRTQLRNATVGDSLRGIVQPGLAEAAVLVSGPAGRVQRVPAEVNGNVSQWTFTETMRSGVYTVAIGGAAGEVDRYAVNLDTRESQLERWDAELLPSQFQRGAEDGAEPAARSDSLSPSQSFRYLLAVVLLLLLCETFLAWFFGRSAAYVSLVP
ncbi:MAG: BatA domain-containing protein [Pirellulaceae bacterium]